MSRKQFEKVFALLLIGLATPLLFFCALGIAITTRGSVIFRQIRVGEAGELFEMYKFRTMHEGAHLEHETFMVKQLDEGGSFLLHMPDDPRVTRFGKFLRKSSLDELPQLFNVLKGNMSLVGPRPILPEELPHLSPNELRRFAVKPGITGLAQINGRSALSGQQYLAYDLELVENFSPFLYWSILLRTPFAVFSGKGAT